MRRRRRRVRGFAASELLEVRALLAATLTDDGVLMIEGTTEADRISVRQEEESIVVSDNGETTEFPADDVVQIDISTGEGDDRVRLARNIEVAAAIDAGDGNDLVRGGAADDTISGGLGNDKIAAGVGNDSVDGGEGNDKLLGGNGDDTLNGDAGNDRIRGGRGNDLVNGGDGNDRLAGNSDNDTLNGGAGNDRMSAGSGENELFGEDGNDLLSGNSNYDLLDGGEGENRIKDRAEYIARVVDSVFERVDRNGDDLITQDEVGFLWTRLADQMDLNDDDAIDRDELTQAVEQMSARFSERLGRIGRRFRGRRRGR